MKKKVEFMSRGQMKKFIETREHLNENVAIISINDTPYEYDDMMELLEGSNFSISMFADSDGNDGISPLQAKCLLSFIDTNYNKDFYVHCFAGVSRSGAVAKFINEYLDRGHMYLEDYKGYNRRVYNTLLAAAGMSLAAYYEELEKQDRMMKMNLEERIKASQKALSEYPEWVIRSAFWQGGGEKRGENQDYKSYGNY